MTGIPLGPFVFAGGRLAALIALAAFLLVLEILAWRRRRNGRSEGFGRWPMIVVLGWVLAARAGYVFANWPAFAAAPADIVKLWQGGFSPTAGGYGAALAVAASALSRRRVILPLATSAVLAALASGTTMMILTVQQSDGASPLTTAPLATLDGRELPLADPPGTPVVVNLWASWCGPCRREMPMMQEIAATSTGVAMRFVNQGERPETITRFLRDENLSSRDVRLDPDRSLMARYGAIGLPATLFFRADGTMAAGVIGEISRAEILRQIANIKAGATQ